VIQEKNLEDTKLNTTQFKFRPVWMALAMIWIVIYHTGYPFKVRLFEWIVEVGYGGVDIFMFASGIGCYCSLAKRPDTLSFYKRRALKIYPTYWSFLIFWFIEKKWAGELALSSIIGNVLGIQSFTGNWNEVNWYLSGIILAYLLAPLFFELIKHGKFNRKIIYGTFFVLLIATTAFWNSLHMNIIVIRVPLFYLGMLYAEFVSNGKVLQIKDKILIIGTSLVGWLLLFVSRHFFSDYLRTIGLWWYPFILIVPGLCLVIDLIFEVIIKSKPGRILYSVLSYIGKYTFEIFLVHLLIFDIYKVEIKKEIFADAWIGWLCAIALIPVGCLILNRLCRLFVRLIKVKK